MQPPRRVAVALNLAEPYSHHQDIYVGVQQFAHDHPHWHCIVDECPGYYRNRRAELYQHYDGVIARASPGMRRRLNKQGIPLVNTWYQHAKKGLPGVYPDAQHTAVIATDHMIARGFRRLSMLVGAESRMSHAIAEAMRRRCDEMGVQFKLCHVAIELATPRDWMNLEKHVAAWLKTLTPPVGVFLHESSLSRVLISLIEAQGWRVPENVSIVSLNDNRMISELYPQISCMDLRYETVGYEAAAMLDRLMREERPPEEAKHIKPGGVISRTSTDYFAVDDPIVASALRFISEHLEEKLTLERIAQDVGTPPRSLQLRFDQALGRPISVEIRRLRLTAAKRMLAEPDRRIGDIAKQTGFTNSIIMNQVFHREVGLSPSAYRKQLLSTR